MASAHLETLSDMDLSWLSPIESGKNPDNVRAKAFDLYKKYNAIIKDQYGCKGERGPIYSDRIDEMNASIILETEAGDCFCIRVEMHQLILDMLSELKKLEGIGWAIAGAIMGRLLTENKELVCRSLRLYTRFTHVEDVDRVIAVF